MNATPHKHKALIDLWSAAPEWWDVYFRTSGGDWACKKNVEWYPAYEYELRKSAKHPDNIKPKKRLIDWSKMPIGTMTNHGEFLRLAEKFHAMVLGHGTRYVYVVPLSSLRLAEQTKFTYWDGKGNPVPEGVVAEYKYIISSNGKPTVCVSKHLMSEHVAIGVGYRITSLADGFTDNSGESV